MSGVGNQFFSLEKNKLIIGSFLTVLESMEPLREPDPEIVGPLRKFFSIFSANTASFDEHCIANIGWIGESFMVRLTEYVTQRSERSRENLFDIFTSSYRLLCELEFSQPGELSLQLRSVKKFVDENLERFAADDRQQIVYANYVMPAYVAKRLIQDSSLADYKAFSSSIAVARDLKKTWDSELKEKKAEVDELRATIERLKTQYNFVGLVNGFENLVKKKVRDKFWSFLSLILLGFFMLVPACVHLWFVFSHSVSIDESKTVLVYTVPAVVTLELIILYFFRVVLVNHRGLQTQLLQLDLRISLCQFIQSYADYSVKIKKNDAAALEKFEAVVFSSLVFDGEKLPATFDGVEQIAKLVKSVRG